MIRVQSSTFLGTLFAAALVVTGVMLVRTLAARRHAVAAGAHIANVSDTLRTLHQLQAAVRSGSSGKKPAPGLTGQVSDALAQAGVPVTAMTSLAPEAETEVSRTGDVARVRHGARLGLEPVTLPQVGRFLQSWRSAHPEWTIISMQLTPLPSRQPQVSGATPGPLRVNLVLQCEYTEFGE